MDLSSFDKIFFPVIIYLLQQLVTSDSVCSIWFLKFLFYDFIMGILFLSFCLFIFYSLWNKVLFIETCVEIVAVYNKVIFLVHLLHRNGIHKCDISFFKIRVIYYSFHTQLVKYFFTLEFPVTWNFYNLHVTMVPISTNLVTF